jgi:D-alanyl-lipoteichoic acid acyltransferase DltB (MBOAT superfamily)
MQVDYLNPLLLFPALALLCLLYYLFPRRLRWLLLLAASYAFLFLLGRWTVLILLASTLLNYTSGLLLGSARLTKKNPVLISAVVLNVGLLVFFKYFVDFLSPESLVFSLLSSNTGSILFPVGLSFYTLQNISYLLDISSGASKPEKNPGVFAAYLAFFPKLVAGPVERARNLIPQLREPASLSGTNLAEGARRIVFGLFFKLVIADRLALFVNEVFKAPGTYQGVTVLVALFFLSFQIYLDFSGYTQIALGAARLLGINLSENFKRPYLSLDFVDFWNRWHISFSSWLRDYIFYPLRYKILRHKPFNAEWLALVIPPVLTMLVSGLWHGAGWTFVVWGLYHALFYTITVMRRKRSKPGAAARVFKTLLNFAILTGGWLIFRADSLTTVWAMLRSIFVKSTTLELILSSTYYLDYLLSQVFILIVIISEVLVEFLPARFSWQRLPAWSRWLIVASMILCLTLFGVYQAGGSAFVYGKF